MYRWNGDDDVHFLFDQHAFLELLAHWNNFQRVDVLLHNYTLYRFRVNNCLLLPLNDGYLAEKQQIPILVFTHEIYDLQLFRKMKCKIWKQKETIHCVYWKENLP